jgi:hypothetical protein
MHNKVMDNFIVQEAFFLEVRVVILTQQDLHNFYTTYSHEVKPI